MAALGSSTRLPVSAAMCRPNAPPFLREWRLECKALAGAPPEAGDRLFAFTRLPPGHGKSARTANANERLREVFRRRIKTKTALRAAETAAMLFWALLASGQIT